MDLSIDFSEMNEISLQSAWQIVTLSAFTLKT